MQPEDNLQAEVYEWHSQVIEMDEATFLRQLEPNDWKLVMSKINKKSKLKKKKKNQFEFIKKLLKRKGNVELQQQNQGQRELVTVEMLNNVPNVQFSDLQSIISNNFVILTSLDRINLNQHYQNGLLIYETKKAFCNSSQSKLEFKSWLETKCGIKKRYVLSMISKNRLSGFFVAPAHQPQTNILETL
jgi:hypothetical protein